MSIIAEKVVLFIVILSTIFLLHIKPESSFGQESINLRKPKLEMKVLLDKEEVKLNDKIKITVNLKNSGKLAFYIYKNLGWGRSSSLSYIIKNKEGMAVIGGNLIDAQDTPPFLEKDFKILKPGERITAETWLDISSEGILESGEYQLSVFYHSPVPYKFAPSKLKVWTKENGIVETETIVFTVTE